MKLYRITLQVLSPPGTPFHSDTLFGHLCWQVKFREGDDGVGEFLQPFLEGKPPFVFSDGFPAGKLPKPMVDYPESDAKRVKEIKKVDYLPVEDFQTVCRGEPLNPLVRIDADKKAKKPSAHWNRWRIEHIAIDRNTFTAAEGQLYQTEVIYLSDGEAMKDQSAHNFLDLYLLAESEEWKERARDLLQGVALSGYGKDKSTGSGHFQIKGEVVEVTSNFYSIQGVNGFVSLSSFVPAAGDPVDGRWKIRVKFGRLGENAGGGMFLKHPLIQFEPGAAFRHNSPNYYYGRMVKNIAPGFKDAVQCGFTIAIPIRL